MNDLQTLTVRPQSRVGPTLARRFDLLLWASFGEGGWLASRRAAALPRVLRRMMPRHAADREGRAAWRSR